MESLVLFRGDYPSEALIRELISKQKAQIPEEPEVDVPEGELPLPAPASFGMITFSGYLTKKAAEKAGKLATEFNIPVFDSGSLMGVLDREGDKEVLPFGKNPLILYACQIITAGALCQQLGVGVLYVPSYREDEKPIPDVAVVVKFARKAVLNSANWEVDVISPYSELQESEIKERLKSYV